MYIWFHIVFIKFYELQRHLFFNQSCQYVRLIQGDVDAHFRLEQPGVTRVVDPTDHPPNPELKLAQRILSRRKKGSGRWRTQRKRVAGWHARVADARRDWLHKLSNRLVKENGFVAIEDLNVRGMMANHCLARAIGDVGMSELRRQLEYKSAWHGRELVAVDRWAPTSKTCSNCGQVHDMPLDKRLMECDCGNTMDRDHNAAINILNFAVGNTVTARGGESSGAVASAVA